MNEERLARLQLLELHVKRLNAQAEKAAAADDLEGLRALRREMEVIHESALAIREEQLLEQLERSRPKPRRRWWRRKP